jgi:hypothetical protein
MKIFILLVIIIIFILLIIIYISINKYKCNYKIKLNEKEYNIISKYIKEEYITATDYLDDNDTIHFYIIDNDILISYFHITINKYNKYFINYMYTNKNYRNKGYMNKLLMYALYVCKEKNIKEVYSWTKLSNKASQNTFLSNNFIIDNITDDDITFVKKL